MAEVGVSYTLKSGTGQTMQVDEVMFNNADRTHSSDFAIVLHNFV